MVPPSGACGAVAITSLLHFAFDDVVSQAASQAGTQPEPQLGHAVANAPLERRDETTAQWGQMVRDKCNLCAN